MIHNYLKLIRIDKPIGIWLLFLPCLFGLVLAQKTQDSEFIYYGLLFFIGAFLMRSAGCVVNDMMDRNFDKKVARTKNRPIASGAISLRAAMIFMMSLLGLAFLVLLQFNFHTIMLGCASLALVIGYPPMKRITFYPQLFLGLTFNLGIIFASTAVFETVTYQHIMLYVACVVWTLIYDTIYGYQDLEDDVKIGVKSTAAKFGKKPQKKLLTFAGVFLGVLLILGIIENFKFAYYPMIFLAFFHLVCQIKTCDFSSPKDCLKKFKSNFWVGVIILVALIFA